MIEFEEKKGSAISPEDTGVKLPSSEEVELFFEDYFKKNVEEYLIYKKNQFKNPNKEIVKDFFVKFESFVKEENKNDDLNQMIKLLFENIMCNIKILNDRECLPDNKKIMSFFMSFIISKFFS
jgi:hypothetical protein